jgi:sugar/nucleoside kinase (ribokinase family)
VNVIAAKWARQNNTLVILDVGGRDDPFTDELLSNIDIISPNEVTIEVLIVII